MESDSADEWDHYDDSTVDMEPIVPIDISFCLRIVLCELCVCANTFTLTFTRRVML